MVSYKMSKTMQKAKDYKMEWQGERLYTCRQFCQRHGLTRYMLRKWETLGLLHPLPIVDKTYYRDSDLSKIFEEKQKNLEP